MDTYRPKALAANLYGMRSAAGMSLKELPQSVHHLRHCRLFRRVAGLALRQSPGRKNPRTGGNR